MFCPNCGTENEETATPCKKCGFKLRGVSAPKFKGTMLLNSDQAIQQLVQEARRRLEQGSALEPDPAPLPPHGGPSALWGNQAAGLRTLHGGLQPPRVTSPRVGRTMMGVAPQIGGYAPPNPEAEPASAEAEPKLGQAAPAAWSEATPAAELAPNSSEQASTLEGLPSPQALRSDAVAANDAPGHWPGTARPGALESAQLATESPLEPGATEGAIPASALEASAPNASAPDIPALPATASAAADLPRRVHPLEIVFVVLTLGLYGLVLWARQREHDATRARAARG